LKPWRHLKQMQLRRVLLPYRSPSAKDTRLRKLKRSPFSNISGNGVRLNGIATRGNEGFLAISCRFIFRPERDATGRLGYNAEEKVAAALRVLGYAEAPDQPDHFLRMCEESIRQSFLRSTQHITEVYARTVKLPTNEDAEVISQRFLSSCRPIFPPDYVRTVCDDFWNLSNQNSAERKKKHPVVIGVHQPIGSNDRCLISSTVGDALTTETGVVAEPPRQHSNCRREI
jgi:hypothetical protein